MCVHFDKAANATVLFKIHYKFLGFKPHSGEHYSHKLQLHNLLSEKLIVQKHKAKKGKI